MYPNDPINDALPMWVRAIAALAMLVFAWIVTTDIEREEEPVAVDDSDRYPQPEYLDDADWQWPAR